MNTRVSFFLLLFASSFALAQPAINNDIQEMEVIGQQQLRALRNQISDTEDRMYSIFNEINDDDDYDIFCIEEARTGTRMTQKVCRPAFLMNVESINGKSFLSRAQGGNYAEGMAPPTNAVLDYQMPRLEEKMKQAIQENPEFFDVVVEHHELREQYDQRISTYWGDDNE